MKKLNQRVNILTFILIVASAGLLLAGGADPVTSTFEKKCSICHDLPDPNGYPKMVWIKNVSRMAERAHLTAQEKTAIMGLNTGK